MNPTVVCAHRLGGRLSQLKQTVAATSDLVTAISLISVFSDHFQQLGPICVLVTAVLTVPLFAAGGPAACHATPAPAPHDSGRGSNLGSPAWPTNGAGWPPCSPYGTPVRCSSADDASYVDPANAIHRIPNTYGGVFVSPLIPRPQTSDGKLHRPQPGARCPNKSKKTQKKGDLKVKRGEEDKRRRDGQFQTARFKSLSDCRWHQAEGPA